MCLMCPKVGYTLPILPTSQGLIGLVMTAETGLDFKTQLVKTSLSLHWLCITLDTYFDHPTLIVI
jgi:hypothetical protein